MFSGLMNILHTIPWTVVDATHWMTNPSIYIYICFGGHKICVMTCGKVGWWCGELVIICEKDEVYSLQHKLK